MPLIKECSVCRRLLLSVSEGMVDINTMDIPQFIQYHTTRLPCLKAPSECFYLGHWRPHLESDHAAELALILLSV